MTMKLEKYRAKDKVYRPRVSNYCLTPTSKSPECTVMSSDYLTQLYFLHLQPESSSRWKPVGEMSLGFTEDFGFESSQVITTQQHFSEVQLQTIRVCKALQGLSWYREVKQLDFLGICQMFCSFIHSFILVRNLSQVCASILSQRVMKRSGGKKCHGYSGLFTDQKRERGRKELT